MKKVIGIFYNAKFSESSFETGCGGSDAWVIQIAKEFVLKGYHVIVFCNCDAWALSFNMVEYVPISLFGHRCTYQHFDYFIMTRAFNEDIYNMVVDTGCENIYVQSHDMFIWNQDMYVEKFIYQEGKYPYLKKFIALTPYHQWELMTYNQIPEDKIAIIGNGLDSHTFSKVDEEPMEEKDNSILFTSVYTRGGDILVEHILPLVKKEIPDFKVKLCGYADVFPEHIKSNPDVEILGMLTKEEYYREFRKHRVWFLPCVVPEDFGLCICEAAMCECEVISPFKHGAADVCYPFVNLAMKHSFDIVEDGSYHRSRYTLNMSDDAFQMACQEAADMIIESIKNYYNDGHRYRLRKSFKSFILGTHTWNNVVQKWKSIFNEK